jgi:hypothetical protein
MRNRRLLFLSVTKRRSVAAVQTFPAAGVCSVSFPASERYRVPVVSCRERDRCLFPVEELGRLELERERRSLILFCRILALVCFCSAI